MADGTEERFNCNRFERNRDGRTRILLWGVIVIALVVSACETPGRHYEPSGPTPSTDTYEPEGDPRYPRAPGTRTGLWFEQPRIRGPLSPSRVIDTALNHQSEADACLGIDDPADYPEGRMVLELVVGPRGKTEQASVFETSIYDRSFQRCMIDLAERWKFRATDVRETRVYLPVNVAPKTPSDPK